MEPGPRRPEERLLLGPVPEFLLPARVSEQRPVPVLPPQRREREPRPEGPGQVREPRLRPGREQGLPLRLERAPLLAWELARLGTRLP